MTTNEIRAAIRLHKDAGHSKLPLPLHVIAKLIEDAERYRALPKIAKEAASAAINGRW